MLRKHSPWIPQRGQAALARHVALRPREQDPTASSHSRGDPTAPSHSRVDSLTPSPLPITRLGGEQAGASGPHLPVRRGGNFPNAKEAKDSRGDPALGPVPWSCQGHALAVQVWRRRPGGEGRDFWPSARPRPSARLGEGRGLPLGSCCGRVRLGGTRCPLPRSMRVFVPSRAELGPAGGRHGPAPCSGSVL